jgi:hypothetical protein
MSLMSRHLPLNPGGKCQNQMSGNPGKGQRVIGLASAPATRRSDVSTSWRPSSMRWSISCMRSTATVLIAPVLTAYMVGTMLGDAFGSVRQVQWAAASFCYTFVGVDAHLGAFMLRLLGTATTNRDRSFTHSLRKACSQAAPATPRATGRPSGHRAGHVLHARKNVRPRKSNPNPAGTCHTRTYVDTELRLALIPCLTFLLRCPWPCLVSCPVLSSVIPVVLVSLFQSRGYTVGKLYR